MATAGAHHAMTAGSIILVDGNRGVDGPAALTRLTPDALFPESETPVPPVGWHAPAGVTEPPVVPPEAERWPGHCYKSPYPLSETYFLAAYSFDAADRRTAGQPGQHVRPVPGRSLRQQGVALSRPGHFQHLAGTAASPPASQIHRDAHGAERPNQEGSFFVQNVYESCSAAAAPDRSTDCASCSCCPSPRRRQLAARRLWPMPRRVSRFWAPCRSKRMVRHTSGAPAGIPLSFQALDERGQAVQIMRSVTYLQPGEVQSCVGCHERRTTTSPPQPHRPGTAAATLDHPLGPRRLESVELPDPGAARARPALRRLPQPRESLRATSS